MADAAAGIVSRGWPGVGQHQPGVVIRLGDHGLFAVAVRWGDGGDEPPKAVVSVISVDRGSDGRTGGIDMRAVLLQGLQPVVLPIDADDGFRMLVEMIALRVGERAERIARVQGE